MLESVFAPWPNYSSEEAEIAVSVLRSNRVNYWTGNQGRRFEKEFANFCDCDFAVALTNGTMALELALRALRIGPGDEVIVTPRSFIASVSAVVMVGATPVFADIDRISQNITPDTVRSVLTEQTRAIIVVHLAGWPCEMDEFMDLADQHDLFVIEDCAQAHGARFKGRPVGGLGHVGSWSFCQDKIISTAGEGGMLTTNDPDIWRRAWEFKDHGKSWEAMHQARQVTVYSWLHESIGSNVRMTEIQAAIGSYQLTKLADWHAARQRNAQTLRQAFLDFPDSVRVPEPPPEVDHAWYKFYAFVRPERLKPGCSRDRILREIAEKGVPCGSGSCSEIYLEKAFDSNGLRPKERLSNARELGETSMMFLVHPTLTEENMTLAVQAIGQVLGEVSL